MREAVLGVSDSELDTLGIGELVALAREAGIQDFETVACEGDSAVVQVEVQRAIDEARIDALDYVRDYERTETSDGTERYVISYATPKFDDEMAAVAAALVGDCDPDLRDDGAALSLVGPQAAIRDAVGEYASAGADVDLERLGEYEGNDDPLGDLTDRQREVLETAFEAGYYEVPRQASTDAVAAELDVDNSTVAEHLQRAERNLLSHHLSD
ncbi:helix-turn-helix domain-containing protein [Halobacterium bonnevillei]|uniref:Helix-turn-helix domain-containing protein n=1 Tax=Halobacterium bonnevillei TaxID=2692200 RepID=A0A6B0STS9_9EURY|nr:helix-turn-helix domain-containing protein [Halobacterium bonnevillei]MXR20979.1 helix-turn-helix domain-containing protein [Halobacterium bonnevillei]